MDFVHQPRSSGPSIGSTRSLTLKFMTRALGAQTLNSCMTLFSTQLCAKILFPHEKCNRKLAQQPVHGHSSALYVLSSKMVFPRALGQCDCCISPLARERKG